MNIQDVYKKMAEDIIYLLTNIADTLKYDKTFRAKVIKQVSSGKYKVLYKNKEYTVRSNRELLEPDMVWVCAPQNNWDELFIV